MLRKLSMTFPGMQFQIEPLTLLTVSLHCCLHSGQGGIECRHRRQPLRGARMASAGELVKFSLQGASDGAGLSAADGAEVDLAQAHDFGSGSADEDFIGDVKLVAGNRLLYHGVTQITRHG